VVADGCIRCELVCTSPQIVILQAPKLYGLSNLDSIPLKPSRIHFQSIRRGRLVALRFIQRRHALNVMELFAAGQHLF
jgi:hypothetical protein